MYKLLHPDILLIPEKKDTNEDFICIYYMLFSFIEGKQGLRYAGVI